MNKDHHYYRSFLNSNSEIEVWYDSNSDYVPKILAFDNSYYLKIVEFYGSINTYWIMGYFNQSTSTIVDWRSDKLVNAIDMKAKVVGPSIILFYTKFSSDTTILYREYLYGNLTNSDVFPGNIGNNCGSVVRGNDQIIAVSCPTYSNGILSVYTIDLEHIKNHRRYE
jgi:hypothetical protein